MGLRGSLLFAGFFLSSLIPLTAQVPSPSGAQVVERRLPIVFEQAPWGRNSSEAMIGRVAGGTVRFQTAAIEIYTGKQSGDLVISFDGAQETAPKGVDLKQSQTNYLLGSNPALWRTHIPNYGKVVYFGLYKGVDAIFYGNGNHLEHDFVVKPGADYRQIRMHFPAGSRVQIGKGGSLTMNFAGASLRMERPSIYQNVNGIRQQRHGAFRLKKDGEIGFTVGAYDPRFDLIIDPVLDFSTYFSPLGSDGLAIAADANGNSYVTGYGTLGFPVTTGAFAGCSTCSTSNVVTFISKLSADGTQLIYSTVLGGNNFAQPTGIAVDANGDAIVSGWTGATDFPTKSGQPILPPNNNYLGFLVSLSPDGSSLNYGTLLSNSPTATNYSMTYATAVTVDSTGNAYVTGETGDGFFVSSGALNQAAAGSSYNTFDVFLAKFSPTGSLVYSAVLGTADPQNGGGGPIGASAVAVDAAGDAFVAGQAGTLWPITSGAYLSQIAGSMPYATPFVMKVAPDAKSVLYSTYLDYGYVVTGLAVLPSGNAMVVGDSAGPNYPTSPSAYRSGSSSGGEPFLAELNAGGSALAYSTTLGDSSTWIYGFALDPVNGNIWVAGETHNPAFPLLTPLQSTFPTSGLGWLGPASVAYEFDPTGETLEFSSFLGTVAGYANGIAIDTSHRAHVSGAVQYGMYTTAGAYDPSVPVPGEGYSGATYAYAAMIDPAVASAAACVTPNTSLYFPVTAVNASANQNVTVTSCGTDPLTITGISAGASVFTIPPASNGCTQQLAVGQSCTFAVSFTPTAVGSDSSTLSIQSDASVPVATIGVSGSGSVPVIAVYYLPSFNYTLVGQTSAPGVLIVSNTGGVPLVLNASATTTSGDFSIQGLGACSSPVTSNCVLDVYFTPTAAGARTGSITLASNDPAHPLYTVQLHGTGYAEAPVPEITSVGSELIPAGSGETSFRVSGFGFLPSSVVELNGVAQPTTFENSSFLTATLNSSSIPANSYGELSLTVVTPAPGGGTSQPYSLTLFQQISGSNSYLLYEPVNNELFISTPASDANHPNSVISVNPATASPGAPIAVGNDPGVLAASSDGKYLYVALNGDHTIQRINLSTNAIERTFSLPVDTSFGKLTVFDMHVVPGKDVELVASLMDTASPSEDGIALFNDSGLVNWIPGQPQGQAAPTLPVDRFTFTQGTSLYAIQPYQTGLAGVGVSASAITSLGQSCCTPSGTSSKPMHLASDGTYIYTDSGLVWDPAKAQPVQSYAVPSESYMDSVVPDASTLKTYFLNALGQYAQYQATTVLAFDQTTQTQTGSLSLANGIVVPNISGTGLVRWGSNGFAMRISTAAGTTPSSVMLFTSGIASSSNQNPIPAISSLTPASAVPGGTDFQLTVNGAGFVPGSTVTWNGTPRLTTMVSSSQLTATVYASDISAAGTAQIAVSSPGPGGGTSQSLPFTISTSIPAVGLTPASVTFPAQTVGTTSVAQPVLLTNTGTGTLTGIAIALVGANAGSFAESNSCGAALAAGVSCTISVTFSPTAVGAASASLAITDNAGSQSVTLSGSGAAPLLPSASVSPGSLTFASQEIGTSSASQPVTLTNSGNATLANIAVAISGSNATSFAQSANCGTSLPAGNSCSIAVTFTPTAAGAATAVLTITDSAATSPQSVTLSGSSPQSPIAISTQSGGSTSSTVTAGRPASYALAITPVQGYAGTVSFSCSNLPANASCSFNPSSLTFTNGSAVNFTVTIATQSPTSAELITSSLTPVLAGLVLIVPLVNRRTRARLSAIAAVLIVLGAAGICGCGGGSSGSGGSSNPGSPMVPPGTYTVQLTVSDGKNSQIQPLTLIVQ